MKNQLPELQSAEHWLEPANLLPSRPPAFVCGAEVVNSNDSPFGGNSENRFHTTHWSAVLAAGDRDSACGQEALARLCQTYWLPVYAFVRKRGHSPDQAKDLTQGFFATFLEKNSVARAIRGCSRVLERKTWKDGDQSAVASP